VKISQQIEALEKLSELDGEIAVLDGDLAQERQALEKSKEQLAKLDGKLSVARASIDDMERTRNELHAEARQMSTQMERSREKLARSRSEREVNAAQREVEELRKLFRDREAEVEKLSQLVEQAKGEAEVTTKERDGIAEQLGNTEGSVTTRLTELEQNAAAKRKVRVGLAEKVQPVIYRRYENIRRKRGSSIAHVTDGTCSACHMRLPPMMFQKMMRGDDFDQCPSCSRILYYRAPAGSGDDATVGNPSGSP
jgi:predicted  nucleic acid-binding Zn-ribbon protein